jgi:hypothetical protein
LSGGPAAVEEIVQRLPTYLVDAPSAVTTPDPAMTERLGAVIAKLAPDAYQREKKRRNGVQAGERLAQAWVKTVGIHWPEETSRTRETTRRIGGTTDALLASPASLLDVTPLPYAPVPIGAVANRNGEPSPELVALCAALERHAGPKGELAVPEALTTAVERLIAPLIMLAYASGSPDDSPTKMIDAGLRAAFGLEPWQARWWALFDANATELATTNKGTFVDRVVALANESLDPEPQLGRLLDKGMRAALVDELARYTWATQNPGGTALSSFGFARRWAHTCGCSLPERAPRPPRKPR